MADGGGGGGYSGAASGSSTSTSAASNAGAINVTDNSVFGGAPNPHPNWTIIAAIAAVTILAAAFLGRKL